MELAARPLVGMVLDEAGCAGVPDARRRLPGPGVPGRGHQRRVHAGWLVRAALDEEFDRLVGTRLAEADAFLFGRRTYQNFARDWPR